MKFEHSSPLSTLCLIGILAILSIFPLFLPEYYIAIGIEIFIMALFALSFNLLFGYTGLLSFGHAAFFGTGAYACALTLKHVSSSVFLGLLGGIILSAIFALIIGFFCVRFTRMYFVMLTVAFGELVYNIGHKWVSLTGGDDGLVGIPISPLRILFLPPFNLLKISNYYYFTFVCVGVSIFIIWRIVNSHFGYVLRAIHENSERVKFVGLEVRRHQLLSFTISGLFAGLAGALLTVFEGMVSPASLYFTVSAEPILMSILGGTRFFFGPIVGAALFIIIKDGIQTLTEFWMVWMGAILVMIVIFLPGGVVGFLHSKFLISFSKNRIR